MWMQILRQQCGSSEDGMVIGGLGETGSGQNAAKLVC